MTKITIILLLFPTVSLPFVLSRHQIRTTIIAAFAFSVLIEATQFVGNLGLCEADDVIFNTLGAAFGTLAFVASKHFVRSIVIDGR